MVAVIYVAGAGPSAPPALGLDPVVRIAADGGLDLAVALGADVDLLVGDLDSVSPEALAAARARGVEARPSSQEKDETDLELAIACAEGFGAAQLVVIGGGGGRLDHLLGVVAVLAGAARRGIDVTAYLGDDRVWLVGPEVGLELSAKPGTTVSVVPVGGPASGVSASGLVWPLVDATLDPFEAIGVSNRTRLAAVTIEVADGVVAVVAPGLEAQTETEAGRPAHRSTDPAAVPTVDTAASPSARFRRTGSHPQPPIGKAP